MVKGSHKHDIDIKDGLPDDSDYTIINYTLLAYHTVFGLQQIR
jgi:hypothetical protein